MKIKRFRSFYLIFFIIVIVLFVYNPTFSYSNEYLKLIKARVIKIVDGDTIWVKINGKRYKIRFIGVNTPELSHPNLGIKQQPYGKEAKEFTSKYLSGKTVYLELDVQQFDKYNRLLAYMWLLKPPIASVSYIRQYMFNAILLIQGYAQVMTVPPNVKYQDLFLQFQKEAREKEAGLWKLKTEGNNKLSETYYVASKKSNKFHYPWCKWAKKIKSYNLIIFKTREDAINAGYIPCKVCNP